jgi:putative SOS response-associated peptidase YedK
MCYSNSSTSTTLQLAERYQKLIPDNPAELQYYFASGFQFPMWPIVTKDLALEQMRWGLLPHWFKGYNWKDFAAKTLNARIETCSEKVAYKHLVLSKRCLIPSSGFFEWQAVGQHKIPYFIRFKDIEIFSFAGLYDTWLDAQSGNLVKTFTIITTEANELMARIHNVKKRMPLILSKDEETSWLNGKLFIDDITDRSNIQLEAWPIDKKRILSADANTAEISRPAPQIFGEQKGLFD